MTEPGSDEVAEQGWEQLSPLSLILRGGVVLLAVVSWMGAQLVSRVGNFVSPGRWRDPSGQPDEVEGILSHPWVSLGILALVIVAAIGAAWMSWRFTRFRVAEHQVELRQGWIFRQQRQVPLDRVQAVEISRPLVAQILGLAKVVVQSAGGKDSNVTLAYLPLPRAHDVRDRIQRAASRLEGYAAGPADEGGAPTGVVQSAPGGTEGPYGSLPGDLLGLAPDTGRLVVQVPNLRLVLASLCHPGVVFLVLAGLAWGIAALTVIPDEWGPFGGIVVALPGLVPMLFGLLSTRVREVLKHGNFRLTDQGRSVRILHGLTDHRTTTVPLRRVQALEIVQPMMWRPMGWWRARVNVAGIHGDDSELTNETVILPVGTLDEALTVLTLVDPALSPDHLRTAALGDGGEANWVTASPRARLFDPLSWRRSGYTVSGHGVLVRRGRYSRRAAAVPHARVQSMALLQGPWDARRDLAAVSLVSTPGPIGIVIPHLSLHDAEAFLDEESQRTSAARRSEGTPCANPAPGDGLSSVDIALTDGHRP